MGQILWTIASVLGATAVGLGAFASHGLRAHLSDRAFDIFEVGTRYQMYHALALLFVASLMVRIETVPISLHLAGIAFITGIMIFSGSLYALSLTGIVWLGAITPIGGLLFMGGWVCLAIAAWQYQ